MSHGRATGGQGSLQVWVAQGSMHPRVRLGTDLLLSPPGLCLNGNVLWLLVIVLLPAILLLLPGHKMPH